MTDDGREHERTGRRDPDIRATASSSHLDGSGRSESSWKAAKYLGVSSSVSSG